MFLPGEYEVDETGLCQKYYAGISLRTQEMRKIKVKVDTSKLPKLQWTSCTQKM